MEHKKFGNGCSAAFCRAVFEILKFIIITVKFKPEIIFYFNVIFFNQRSLETSLAVCETGLK